ncbi:hypothetical protein PM082_007513 [Marasmius tenuissimus]|nr:hypothetical protein PM082_007513 [Marasmius tenuissimus]
MSKQTTDIQEGSLSSVVRQSHLPLSRITPDLRPTRFGRHRTPVVISVPPTVLPAVDQRALSTGRVGGKTWRKAHMVNPYPIPRLLRPHNVTLKQLSLTPPNTSERLTSFTGVSKAVVSAIPEQDRKNTSGTTTLNCNVGKNEDSALQQPLTKLYVGYSHGAMIMQNGVETETPDPKGRGEPDDLTVVSQDVSTTIVQKVHAQWLPPSMAHDINDNHFDDLYGDLPGADGEANNSSSPREDLRKVPMVSYPNQFEPRFYLSKEDDSFEGPAGYSFTSMKLKPQRPERAIESGLIIGTNHDITRQVLFNFVARNQLEAFTKAATQMNVGITDFDIAELFICDPIRDYQDPQQHPEYLCYTGSFSKQLAATLSHLQTFSTWSLANPVVTEDQVRSLLPAFCHFVFENSGGEMVIQDIIYTCDASEFVPIEVIALTLYSSDLDGLRKAEANCALRGFRDGHICNAVCQALGLTSLTQS